MTADRRDASPGRSLSCVSVRDVVFVVGGGALGWAAARAVLRSRRLPVPLTRRQVEILSLVERGLTTKEIARQAGISEHSVNTHIRRATRTLGVGTRAAAVAVVRGSSQAGAPARPRRSPTRSRAVTISPTSSSNGT